jgi:polyferredoxin
MSAPAPTLESVTTINANGSRRFIHPADVRGPWTRWRTLVGLALLAVYFALPWITINGHPAVFLDVAQRKFHLFGLTFVTQDLWVAFFLVSGLGFGLFYVTALLGRIWCGWACPQTVYLDFIRRIERWLEGDAPARERLDRLPWTGEKLRKRGTKYVLFFLFAALLAHMFLTYYVSPAGLRSMMSEPPTQNWPSFVFVFLMTGAMWFDFVWFREQFCIVLCPYGRLQSALIDNDSLVIGYDSKRGEPRGKKGTEGAGDCIDCRRCVHVCPTGIDIRQGLQMECIGCAACVDACDEIMTKLDRPRGLVRYDSSHGFAGKARRILRPRILALHRPHAARRRSDDLRPLDAQPHHRELHARPRHPLRPRRHQHAQRIPPAHPQQAQPTAALHRASDRRRARPHVARRRAGHRSPRARRTDAPARRHRPARGSRRLFPSRSPRHRAEWPRHGEEESEFRRPWILTL